MGNLQWAKEIFRTLPGTRLTNSEFSNDHYLVSRTDGVVYDEVGHRYWDMSEECPAEAILPDEGWHFYKGGPAR